MGVLGVEGKIFSDIQLHVDKRVNPNMKECLWCNTKLKKINDIALQCPKCKRIYIVEKNELD